MTSRLVGEIEGLLERKREIDRRNQFANNMASYDQWSADALCFLLKLQLELLRNDDGVQRA